MAGYYVDIEKRTRENKNFREVLFTGQLIQLVVMSLKPGEEIGLETYVDTDQYISVEDGNGKAIVDEIVYELKPGSALVIPAGTEYNIINTSTTEALKLSTVYIPPDYAEGTIDRTKSEGIGYGRGPDN
ncbi:MAG: cupin domain-containing protein [Chloroflexi bacterium]|nr:MAG: cupin domain-containing protein [Chloroflexota bacterium]